VLDIILLFVLIFFSSRRRHTRSKRDWSSDVCSSDLINSTVLSDNTNHFNNINELKEKIDNLKDEDTVILLKASRGMKLERLISRSEERRVGKECKYGYERNYSIKICKSTADIIMVML